ncbi:MAG: methionine--tRNA ligase [Bacteroidota bacterium]
MGTYHTQTFTITAALPYANGPIHIGHLAGAYLPADIYARYMRLRGHKVLFVCGSDEGGVAILLRAKKEGISPQEIIDHYHHQNKKDFSALGISFDVFDRTSNPLHHKEAAAFFTKLYQDKKLEIATEEQLYDNVAKLFLADRYLQGECPYCHFKEAYGDQCESCGNTLSPTELIAPRSKLSGAPLVRKKTTHWYFPLQNYAAWLKQWMVDNNTSWKSNVYGQCQSWLEAGLRRRSITRDLAWGIPVPLAAAKGKVLYVWFEAPIGYISATKVWAKAHQKDWRTFWQDEKTQLVHFIGKDNIVFHAIIFPAMLKAHGGYILPRHVVANEFMNLEGQKLSTSRNHAVWLKDYLATYPEKEDVLRYILCAQAPETKDSNFRWEDYQTLNNQELVGIVGNFAHRLGIFTAKYFQSKIPQPSNFLPIDKAIIAQISALPAQIGHAIENYKFKKGLAHLITFARLGNKYLADTAPWKKIKENPTRVSTILYICLQILAHFGFYGRPFLPFTSEKISKIFGCTFGTWDDAYQFEKVPAGQPLSFGEMLFEKILAVR